MTFPTPAFASAYGPIWSSFGPSAFQKFQTGFLQKQVLPGRNHPVFPGGSFGGSPMPVNSGASLAPQGMQFNMSMPGFPNLPAFPNPQWPPLQLPDDSAIPDGEGTGGGGDDGTDNVGVLRAQSSGGGGEAVLQALTTEGGTATFNTIDAADSSITVDSSGGAITLKSNAAGSIQGSDTIEVDGTTTPTTLSGLYLSSDVHFTALLEKQKTITNYWGIGRIKSSVKLHDFFWEYTFDGIAGICASVSNGTCYNMSEVALAGSDAFECPVGSTHVGGVDICSSDYPSGFEPKPYNYKEASSGANYLRYSYVFIWKDITNRLGKDASGQAYYFQALTPHDGSC